MHSSQTCFDAVLSSVIAAICVQAASAMGGLYVILCNTQAVPDSIEAPTHEAMIALLEATLEATHDGLLVVDLERRIRRFNRQFLEMFRVPPEIAERGDGDEMVAFIAAQLEDPDAILLRSPGLWTDLSGEFLTLMRFKDGRVFERFVAPQHIAGAIVGRVISYHDISRAVRTEQALEQHRAFLEKAQEVAHVGSWVSELDGSGRLGWSAETYRIFGVPREAFPGTSDAFFAFVHPDDREVVRAAVEAAIETGAPYDIVHRILTGDGVVRWVHEKADILRDAGGRPARMIGTAQDITGRRQLEEQLRQAQKLDAIGLLAGGIAHDLNNALTAIAGYTELALGVLPAEHAARADVQEIRRAAERAGTITRQLLAFSRKQRLEPRVFDLNEVVRDVGRLLERLLGGNVRLRTALTDERAAIHADPGQIEQAIINLAVNGRDAMPGGGEVVIGTSVVRLGAPLSSRHATIPAGTYVTLSVADTGHGMSAETQAHIFEPFFTTKDVGKGTGLGLSMVYGTVNQSGGFVWVESEPYRGTTFRLYFPQAATHRPASAAAPVASPPPIASSPTPAAEHTILVVEDEDSVRELVASTLARDGYRVLRAASAEDALGRAADAGRIDLLLTDARMPGMSGIALARILLETHPDLPVVVMSGYSEEVLDMAGFPASAQVLQKPFTPKLLRQRIREILGTSPQPPAPSP
jgi:PAS domain S-box-containing protein